MREISVRIDELVLHGFPAGDRDRIAREVQRELGRLLGETTSGGRFENAAIERLSGGSFAIGQGAQARSAGVGIARTIYRGLRQQSQRGVSKKP